MRQFFFLGILIVGVLAFIIYFCWSVITAIYYDWMLGRHVGAIKAASNDHRAQRAEEAKKRLDNGCDHAFGESLGGFPPNACHKCGIESERPSGNCDHVWRMTQQEAVPSSYCEKCGKRYVSARIGT